MSKTLLIAALVPAMSMAAVFFSPCPSGAPTPTSLAVNNCAGNECTLVAGQPFVALASDIVSRTGSSTATAKIAARLGGIGFAYPVPIVNTGGIVGGGTVVAGVPFSYILNVNSLDVSIRGIRVQVEVDLIGDRGVILACVRFNAKIR